MAVVMGAQTLAPIAATAQIGTVIEGPTEYFSGRLTKKQRKQTIVDEILADRKIRYWNRPAQWRLPLSANCIGKVF